MKINTIECIKSNPPDWNKATIEVSFLKVVDGAHMYGTKTVSMSELPLQLARPISDGMQEIINLNADWLCICADISWKPVIPVNEGGSDESQHNYDVHISCVGRSDKSLRGFIVMHTKDNPTLHLAAVAVDDLRHSLKEEAE